MVDYSKWNNLHISDSDEDSSDDDEPTPTTPFAFPSMNNLKNNNVAFPSYFYSDPKKYVPVKCQSTGKIQFFNLLISKVDMKIGVSLMKTKWK